MRSLKQYLQKKRDVTSYAHTHSAAIDEKTILHITKQVIRELYGLMGEKNIHPKRYKDHILFLQTDRSVWANEVLLSKRKILAYMREKFIEDIIQDIRIDQ